MGGLYPLAQKGANGSPGPTGLTGAAGAAGGGTLLESGEMSNLGNAQHYIKFFQGGPAASQANAEYPVPAGGAQDLICEVSVNTCNEDVVVTIQKNGSDTAITVTIPAGETGTFEDETDTATFDDGDTITLLVDSSAASSGSISFTGIVVLFTPSGGVAPGGDGTPEFATLAVTYAPITTAHPVAIGLSVTITATATGRALILSQLQLALTGGGGSSRKCYLYRTPAGGSAPAQGAAVGAEDVCLAQADVLTSSASISESITAPLPPVLDSDLTEDEEYTYYLVFSSAYADNDTIQGEDESDTGTASLTTLMARTTT